MNTDTKVSEVEVTDLKAKPEKNTILMTEETELVEVTTPIRREVTVKVTGEPKRPTRRRLKAMKSPRKKVNPSQLKILPLLKSLRLPLLRKKDPEEETISLKRKKSRV